MNKPNDAQKVRLNKISKWKNERFPNGSDYMSQFLPDGKVDGIEIERGYDGYYCSLDGETVHVSYNKINVGVGVNLGIHFCSVDQGLADLI